MRNTTQSIRPVHKSVNRPVRRRIARVFARGGGGGRGGGAASSGGGPATDYSKLTGDASFE